MLVNKTSLPRPIWSRSHLMVLRLGTVNGTSFAAFALWKITADRPHNRRDCRALPRRAWHCSLFSPWETTLRVRGLPSSDRRADAEPPRQQELWKRFFLGPIVGDQTVIGGTQTIRGEPFGNLFRSENSPRPRAKRASSLRAMALRD